MKSLTLKTILTLGAVTMGASAAMAQDAPTHCADYRFIHAGGASIAATCLGRDGLAETITVALPGIENRHGTLVIVNGPSTFQQSCAVTGIDTAPEGLTLSALCRHGRDEFVETSIVVPGVYRQLDRLRQEASASDGSAMRKISRIDLTIEDKTASLTYGPTRRPVATSAERKAKRIDAVILHPTLAAMTGKSGSVVRRDHRLGKR
ncbi:hypothetical protein [Cognatishimia sp. F0-27]|uniref:hypothetical protein n=1 Tax=Cognatishimia sp. F0-27 TaxID=2816855 RepID=UPI001D0C6643|nr:hypothetical protein [Cognatishimia sp. F0-27]MCC1491229.1 hypothetical protein [Cognatishimia sp. F0-27]